MKKVLLSIAVFAAAMLVMAMLWHGVLPAAEVQATSETGNRKDIKPIITEIIPGHQKLEVPWSYNAEDSAPVYYWAIRWTYTGSDQSPTHRLYDANARSYTIPGLVNGRTYEVKLVPILVNADNRTEEGVWSEAVNGTPATPLRPGKPTGLKVSQQSAGSLGVDVSFDAVEAADYYLIRWRESGPGNRLNEGVREQDSGADSYTRQIQMNSIGTWVVRVEACNDGGCSNGNAKTITLVAAPEPTPTPRPAPPKPPSLTVETQMNSLTINVAWRYAPWSNVGEYRYKVKLSPPDEGRFYHPASVIGGNHARIEAWRGYGRYTVGVQTCWNDDEHICSPLIKKDIHVEGTTPSRMSNFEVKDVSSTHSAVSASWDGVPHAGRYEIKWRKRHTQFSPEHVVNLPSNKTSIEIALPSGGAWVVRVRACNVNLCGPPVSETLSVTHIIQVQYPDEIQNLRVGAKKGSWFGYVTWDSVEGATYYKVWYADRDNPTAGMVPHRVDMPKHIVPPPRMSHVFDVPGPGRWDFLLQACDDDGCFAAAHTEAFFNEPVEE